MYIAFLENGPALDAAELRACLQGDDDAYVTPIYTHTRVCVHTYDYDMYMYTYMYIFVVTYVCILIARKAMKTRMQHRSEESAAVLMSRWPLGFQTSKKASPMFLFAAPWFSAALVCTCTATALTSLTISARRTSVQSVKLRISQNPKMACTISPPLSMSSLPACITFALSRLRPKLHTKPYPLPPKPSTRNPCPQSVLAPHCTRHYNANLLFTLARSCLGATSILALIDAWPHFLSPSFWQLSSPPK